MTKRLLAIAVCVVLTSFVCRADDKLVGSWRLVRDSDGTTPRPGATITLTLNADGTLKVKAAQPGETVEDTGSWEAAGGKITLHFDELDNEGVDDGTYSLAGPMLTLPFRMIGAGRGTSVWRSATAGQAKVDDDTTVLAVIQAELKEAQAQENANQRRKMDQAAARGGASLAENYYGQAVAFFLKGYLNEAWYGFAKAASLSPTNAVYLNNLSSVLMELERIDAAIMLLDWVNKYFPTLDSPFANRGIAALRAGDCGGARKALTTALRLSPENGMYEYSLCEAERCAGNEQKAEQYCQLAWRHGYAGKKGGEGEGEDGEGEGEGEGQGGKGKGSGAGKGGTKSPGGTKKPTGTKPPKPPKPKQDQKKGIPKEWVGRYQAQYVRARSGENAREATTQFGQGMTGTTTNLQTLACAKQFSMTISADGTINGQGKIMYVYQGKAINPAMALMPMAGVASQGGFAVNLKGGFQLRDWSFRGRIDEDGNIEVTGLPEQELDLLNVGQYQKIKTWSPFPVYDKSQMRGPFRMTLVVEENTKPVIHVDHWLELGDRQIRRVHYQARIVKSDESITPDCKYEEPKKPKCPARESLKTKVKYAKDNGMVVEVSKDLGSGDMGTAVGVKGAGSKGSLEGTIDNNGSMSLEGEYGAMTGSVQYDMTDGSYQISAGVGISTEKMTKKGFPGKITEKLQLTYDSKCGWGIKGTLGGELGSASAEIEGTVFLTQGP